MPQRSGHAEKPEKKNHRKKLLQITGQPLSQSGPIKLND